MAEHRVHEEVRVLRVFDSWSGTRAVCECGWRGCWYADPSYADASAERHLRQHGLTVCDHLDGSACNT